MQAQIREFHAPAVAAGIAVLGGVAIWQWGIELERAWLRSDGGPLPGDSLPDQHRQELRAAELDEVLPAIGERRRWVSRHTSRVAPAAAHPARR